MVSDPDNIRVVSGFIPMQPNAIIEKGGTTTRELNKGAFTDEARDRLADAVKAKKPTVVMDKWLMRITYKDKYVFINAVNQMTPSGCFYYDTLNRRPWRYSDAAEAEVIQ
jgi:hypothetical protein